MSATTIPAGYRLARKWSDVRARDWTCCHRLCVAQAVWGVQTEDCDGENDQDEGNGACAAHAVEIGALVPVTPGATPEECNCEQALSLKAQLREAAAHVGELLAVVPGETTSDRVAEAVNLRNAARAWLTAYLAAQGGK